MAYRRTLAIVIIVASIEIIGGATISLEQGTGTIIGTVVDAETDRPIPGAVVELAAPPLRRRVMADELGRFVSTGWSPGSISVVAMASGYINASPEQRLPSGPSQPVVLKEASRLDSTKLRMWRYAVLAGHVMDERGEPAVGLTVRAMQRQAGGTHERLAVAAETETDDRGVFRFASLLPGQYRVVVPNVRVSLPAVVNRASSDVTRQLAASRAPLPRTAGVAIGEHVLLSSPGTGPLPQVGKDGLVEAYPTAVSPPLDRAPIALNPGQVRKDLELTLRLTATTTVSGTLTGPEGPAALTGVRLTSVSGLEAARTATDPLGRFTFLGVPIGEYQLTSESGNSAQEPTLFASLPVSIGVEKVESLAATLQVGRRLSGSVVVTGTGVPPSVQQLARAAISLRPVDEAAPHHLPRPVGVGDDMTFQTHGYPPGRYLLTVPSPAPGWHLASAEAGGRDVSLVAFELDGDIPDVVLTFSNRGAQIKGVVRGSPMTVSDDATIAVFPADLRSWIADGMNSRQVASTPVGPEGQFVISNLPAGTYTVVTWNAEPSDDLSDPDFLGRIAPRGTTVTLRAGQEAILELRRESVSSDELDEALPHEPDDAFQNAGGGSGLITGVIEGGDGTPLRRATVRLSGLSLEVPRVVTTDDKGQFLFAGLGQGSYVLSATKEGYVDGAFGARGDMRAGTPLRLLVGQEISGIRIRLSRGAVVTGTVRDAFGRPMQGAQVVMMEKPTDGGALRRPASFARINWTTDDEGRYRVYGLSPGDYVVVAGYRIAGVGDLSRTTLEEIKFAASLTAATGPPQPMPDGEGVGFAPVFYPGTTDAGNATVFSLRSGDERTGIDINVVPVRTARLSGAVVGLADPSRTGVQVVLQADESARIPALSAAVVVRTMPDGTFSASGLLPGQYTLVARVSGGSASAVTHWAMQPLEVRGEDLEGIRLVLSPALTMTGRISFDSQAALSAANPSLLSARLIPTGSETATTSPNARVTESGTFQLTGIIPGAYMLSVSAPGRAGQAPIWSMKSAMAAGVEVSDEAITIRAGVEPPGVTVTMTDRPSSLSGRVLDADGRPTPDWSVVIFSTNRAHWLSGSRRRPPPVRPDNGGLFGAVWLPPGDYYLAPVSQVEVNDMNSPSFLESLVAGAVKVTIAEGERKVQNLIVPSGG